MIINLDPKAGEAQWQEFQPGLRIKINPYLRSLVRRVLRESAIVEPADVGGVAGVREKVDPELWDKTLYRALIDDIDGLVDPSGHPVPMPPAAAILPGMTEDQMAAAVKANDFRIRIIDVACEQIEGFAAWVIAKSQHMAAQITAPREEAVKNSKRSRGGKKNAPEA